MKSEKEIRAFRDDLLLIFNTYQDGDAASFRVKRFIEALSWALGEEPSVDAGVEAAAAGARALR